MPTHIWCAQYDATLTTWRRWQASTTWDAARDDRRRCIRRNGNHRRDTGQTGVHLATCITPAATMTMGMATEQTQIIRRGDCATAATDASWVIAITKAHQWTLLSSAISFLSVTEWLILRPCIGCIGFTPRTPICVPPSPLARKHRGAGRGCHLPLSPFFEHGCHRESAHGARAQSCRADLRHVMRAAKSQNGRRASV